MALPVRCPGSPGRSILMCAHIHTRVAVSLCVPMCRLVTCNVSMLCNFVLSLPLSVPPCCVCMTLSLKVSYGICVYILSPCVSVACLCVTCVFPCCLCAVSMCVLCVSVLSVCVSLCASVLSCFCAVFWSSLVSPCEWASLWCACLYVTCVSLCLCVQHPCLCGLSKLCGLLLSTFSVASEVVSMRTLLS